MIPLAKPQIGPEEKQAVLEVLESGLLAQGQRVAAFEQAFANYTGTKFAVATSSGTTALELALRAHGIGPGDEVITSPFSFIATANAIRYVGATPVFVDIEPGTFNLDPALLRQAITPRTRAVMPVHLFGQPCRMPEILGIAAEYNLTVIEDAAQAHGASFDGRRVGSFGSGVFSFYPTKNMTSGEGGMITTDSEKIAEKCRLLRNHGMRERYRHEEIGYNYRMTDIHAAIGLAQLPKLDGWNRQRQANAHFINQGLDGCEGIVTPEAAAAAEHVYSQYTIRVKHNRRAEFTRWLSDKGIGYGIYYPAIIPAQPIYQADYQAEAFPVAEAASREVVSLPIHPALSEDDLSRIVAAVREFFKG